ncbi:MAG: hypothetical protein JSW53_04600 [Candidatus Bathyarchaeota archaeon]|nr:MAG: hypothetical protein JSW53_04600 [Candidatus Bathyarchaeota archaeon]
MMKSLQALMKRLPRILLNKRAVNNAVSATILTGVVIALSLAVFGWAQARSSDYNSEYGETVDSEMARLKEKLAFEYIFYDDYSCNLTVFLLNCGTIDGIEIKTVYINDGDNDLIKVFSEPTLYSFQGWDEIPDQVLDMGDEGRLVLRMEMEDGFYSIKVVTERGATFDSGFVV